MQEFNWVQYFVGRGIYSYQFTVMENGMISCVGSLMDVFLIEFLGLLALLFF